MVAATDSRHFVGLTDKIFRFSPVRANADDLKRFHAPMSASASRAMRHDPVLSRLIENAAG